MENKSKNNSENKAMQYDNVLCTGFNSLSKTIHNRAVQKGFWDEEREVGTLLMLCVSELGEALEADRKSRYANTGNFEYDLKESGLCGGDLNVFANKSFEEHIKDTFQDEIADTIIRLLDLCGKFNIDIDKHINYKLDYNLSRDKMHGKRY